VGERWRGLVRAGRTEVPAELAALLERVKDLEAKLEAQEREIAQLESEQPSTT
jgi:hypothetical protein